MLRLYERVTACLFVAALAVLAIVAATQAIRSENTVASAYDTEKPAQRPVQPANYPLMVYFSGFDLNYRTWPGFEERPTDAAGALQAGNLFYISDGSVQTKEYKHEGWPRDSSEVYAWGRVNVLKAGKVEQNRAAAYQMTQRLDGQAVAVHDYLPVRAQRLTDWIIWRLKQEPKPENIIRIGGYYGVRIERTADLHTPKGENVGFIRSGWVFSTPETPFSCGMNRPELMRVVGWSGSPEPDSVEVRGLYFVDTFDQKGRQTFNPMK